MLFRCWLVGKNSNSLYSFLSSIASNQSIYSIFFKEKVVNFFITFLIIRRKSLPVNIQVLTISLIPQIPHVEGKAGMAAIADPEKTLDLTSFAKGLRSSLPVYARPLFVRILPESPLTATFKLKKKELMEEGFNLENIKDPMYFLDQKTGEYVPLTQKLYDDIMQDVVRL